MRQGTEHKFPWEKKKAELMAARTSEALEPAKLRERFHKVILSAGYSETAAQGILTEYFEKYMGDVAGFVNMLENYEASDGDPD